MIYAALIFASAVSISLTAAYFSVVGLAIMFPGSQAAVMVMGAVLEIGKLVGAVWLHQNWNTFGRVIRYYLLFAVLILMGITSMGIFGYLSKAHIEHQSLVSQERIKVQEIDEKITRLTDNIARQQRQVNKIESKDTEKNENISTIIETLQNRIAQLNQESTSNIAVEEGLINKLDSYLSVLDEAKKLIAEKGGFGKSGKLKDLAEKQAGEREEIKNSRTETLDRIKSHRDTLSAHLIEMRGRIDSLQSQPASAEDNSTSAEKFYLAMEGCHDQISTLNLEKIQYEKQINLIEAEVGPIKYIAAVIEDVGGSSLSTDKMIRVVIIIFIFVFDPLAVILLIASTITYSSLKGKELPPDVKEIRYKLLDELEEYLEEGGIAEHFIERAKK
jgi:hypothetical protein